MRKTLNKLGIEENYLYIMQVIYEKPATNWIFNSERLKAIPLRSGTRVLSTLATSNQHDIGSPMQRN